MSEYFGYGILGFGGGVRPNYLLQYAVQAGGGGVHVHSVSNTSFLDK